MDTKAGDAGDSIAAEPVPSQDADANADTVLAAPAARAYQERLAHRRAGFLQRLAAEPHAFDFYQTLRRLESLHPELPRLGTAARPADEPIRLGQEPSLAFAPAPIAAVKAVARGQGMRLVQRIFGLLGPNGPMPRHLTEYARERELHKQDVTFSRFLDMFGHRMGLLFYRAWAQAQPTVSSPGRFSASGSQR
jgi:type VI secretion system protein ImpH